MELTLIETLKEGTIEAILHIEKGLLYSSFTSNYMSKNLCTNISIDEIIEDIAYGIGIINTVNHRLVDEEFTVAYKENKKIVLDSQSIDTIKSTLHELCDHNFRNGIFLRKVSIFIMDGLV